MNADSTPACVLRSTVEQASCLFFLCFLSHRELENVLESSRKRKEREREREKVIWNQVEKEKEGRIEIGMGIRLWWRKNKRKKKKKKRNVWMKLRKEK